MAIVADKARPQSIVDKQITATGDSFKREKDITPSDTVIHSPRLQSIICGTSGTLRLVNSNGETCNLTVVAGQTILAEIAKVMATGTSATGLVGQH